MEFKIERTSICANSRPCEEAYLKERKPIYDTRNCSVEYFDKHHSKYEGKWFSKGTDHINKPNYIQRTVGTTNIWAVEINSLAELTNFIAKYGKVVMEEDYIEIYDDYRE